MMDQSQSSLTATTQNLHRLAAKFDLVLASGSPRRVQLLGETGVEFRQIVSQVDETRQPGEDAFEYALRLARAKALAVAAHSASNDITIGCDTIVVLDQQVLGKPGDETEAFTTLALLSGQTHIVSTAVGLAHNDKILCCDRGHTKVTFNQVTPNQIRDYIATGEPMDKAGAYGIQGMGSFLVDSFVGPLDNVIGLPRKLLDNLAQQVLDERNRQRK